MLHFLPSNSLIPTPPSPPPASRPYVHQVRRFVYISPVHRPPSQNSRAGLSLAEHRGRIEPEVLAVGEATLRVRIRLLPLVLGTGRGTPARRRLDEGIHAEQLAPLLEEAAVVVLVTVAVAVRVRLPGSARWRVAAAAAAAEGGAGACEGTVEGCGTVVVYAEHVLVGCHAAGNLDELHEEEHAYPGQLQSCPYCEKQRVGVGVDDFTERR
ncbi:hypothetical protein BR93DRAFT_239672 [Coniochaeta sp. PMI_546]|nr:hypothetical protein BR93DRAFT_239672 [Coniochaeta sp. PMI_546]